MRHEPQRSRRSYHGARIIAIAIRRVTWHLTLNTNFMIFRHPRQHDSALLTRRPRITNLSLPSFDRCRAAPRPINRLTRITKPIIFTRNGRHIFTRATQSTPNFVTMRIQGIINRRQRVTIPFTRQHNSSLRSIRTMVRVFTGTLLLSHNFRISINYHRCPRVRQGQLATTSTLSIFFLRGARRVNLRLRQRVTSFVRRRYTTINHFSPPSLTLVNTNGNTFFITGRFKLGRIFKGHTTVSHRRKPIITLKLTIRHTHSRFFTNTTFTTSRR